MDGYWYWWFDENVIRILLYTLRIFTIKPLHLILLDFHRTFAGTTRSKFDDPQRGPPPFSLPTSCPRFLQNVHRALLQIFRQHLECLFPLFLGGPLPNMSLSPAPRQAKRRDGRTYGKTYDLECVKIWERSARSGQSRHCGECRSRFRGVDVRLVRENDRKFGEPRARSHKYWDQRQSVIITTPKP